MHTKEKPRRATGATEKSAAGHGRSIGHQHEPVKRISSVRQALEAWEEASRLFTAKLTQRPEQAAETGIEPEYIAASYRDIGRLLLEAGSLDGTGEALVQADGSLTATYARLRRVVSDELGPVRLSKLAEELRSAHKEYVMAQAFEGRDPESMLQALSLPDHGDGQKDGWSLARELFPRGPAPWHLFPDQVADSMQQLARACATTSTSLVGASLAVLASAVGRKIVVSPKTSWREPLVLWVADIRESGAGKTHTTRALVTPFYERQKRSHEQYEREVQEYEALPPKERRAAPKPLRPRGYFATDVTLEGLRAELADHPTGGIVVLLDELSSFVSGQNQYKGGKGSDRETWLCLHDGKPGRPLRAGGAVFVSGVCVQLVGGIQPEIFREAFGGKSGAKFQEDGTIFRFLPVFESCTFIELTRETWMDENRDNWSRVIGAALEWADVQDQTSTLLLEDDAFEVFRTWSNELVSRMPDLPSAIRGFIPKAKGHALRLAGLLWILETISDGHSPQSYSLGVQDIRRGIELAEWFLSNAVDAVHYLTKPGATAKTPDVSTKAVTLARTLEEVEDQAENGRVGIGWLKEQYNCRADQHDTFTTPHAFGAYVRSLGLKISNGLHDFQGRRRVKCLCVDEKTKSFRKSCLHSLHSLQTAQPCGLSDGDNLSPKSPKSPSGREAVVQEVMQQLNAEGVVEVGGFRE